MIHAKKRKSNWYSYGVGVVMLVISCGPGESAQAADWEKVIDFGYEGYSETGKSWRTYNHPQSNDGSYRYLSHWDRGVERVGTATWTTTVPYSGVYRVAISYRQTDNRTPDANYFVTNNSGGLDEFVINQHGSVALIWKTLGEYTYRKGQEVQVILDGTDDNYSDCADAASWTLVRREQVQNPVLTPLLSPLLDDK